MNADQVDVLGVQLAAMVEARAANEGIVGPLTPGRAARIRTIGVEADPEFTFGVMVDVARSNRIVVTATAFHGKVEA